MEYIFKNIFLKLLFGLLKLLDGICKLFNILCGTQTIDFKSVDGEKTTTLNEYFISDSIVLKVFLSIFLISVLVCAICTTATVIKNMFSINDDNRKSHTKTITQAVYSLVSTLVIAVIVCLSITASSALLGTLNSAFSVSGAGNMSFSAVIIDLGVEDGKAIDWELTEQIKDFQINRKWKGEDYSSLTEEELLEEITEKDEFLELREQIKSHFGAIWDIENEQYNWYAYGDVVSGWNVAQDGTNFTVESLVDENGYIKQELSSQDIFGTYTSCVIFPNGWDNQKGFINGGNFNLLLPFVAVIILLYVMLKTSFQLVKRLFEIVMLILMLPLVNATVPLDDGVNMKMWREALISKVLVAFGAVFSLGLFLVLTPFISNLITSNSILRMLLLVGSGLGIASGMKLFSKLIGIDTSPTSKNICSSAKELLAGASALLGIGKNSRRNYIMKKLGGAVTGKSNNNVLKKTEQENSTNVFNRRADTIKNNQITNAMSARFNSALRSSNLNTTQGITSRTADSGAYIKKS